MGRRDALRPDVDTRRLFREAARPESIDEYAKTVSLCRGSVDAFHVDLHGFGNPDFFLFLAPARSTEAERRGVRPHSDTQAPSYVLREVSRFFGP